MKVKRYVAMYTVMALFVTALLIRLMGLQIAKGEYYRKKSDARTTKYIELIAPRGEILDRFGRKIVENRTGYNVYIRGKSDRKNEELNMLINNLIVAVKSTPNDIYGCFPVVYSDGKYRFYANRKDEKAWKEKYGFDEKLTAPEAVKKLCDKFDISTDKFSKQRIPKIIAIRLDMANKGFSKNSSYVFCEDVPLEEVSVIKEQNTKYPYVYIVEQPVRDYPYGSVCAHTLGHVGKINESEYESRKNYGYTFNSKIGKDGVERLMEDFLRGENGYGSIEQTQSGLSGSQTIEKKPKDGRDICLTIDLDLQIACEQALEETIATLGDADAGSMVVIDINSGEVLAMASYPSHDLRYYSRDYNDMVQDKSKPLFNRSIAGTYAPASTFKILVGAAGLEEKVITTDEEIYDTGKYTYFKDYQPACWIYNQTGKTHGYENVTEAIRDSCNIFFYETGRRLTIGKINKYAEIYGFGKKSGIELENEEKSGMVASPENRKKMGGVWYPGDTCQTAIGQSDTLATPIQLANYTAMIANGGSRYKPHIIKSVKSADNKADTETKPEILEKINIKKENYAAVTNGIRKVVTEGTALKAFAGCKTEVAAKTGSAQTAGEYTNGVCIAYAPFDNPSIAIACVIEKAGSGANTAGAIRKVVDSYFNDNNENMSPFNTLTK